MRWRDLRSDDPEARWCGLVFTAARGALRTEVAPRRLLRLGVPGQPLLWARIADDYCDYEYLVARQVWSEGFDVVPALRFELVHEARERSADEQRRYWARHFVEALLGGGRGPLVAGEHVLLACSADHWEEVPRQPRQACCCWDLGDETAPLALRDPCSLDRGRVQAFRKLARAGALPPVLLWWHSGLDRFVILDGVHRAIAALEEGIAPAGLALTRYGERRSSWDGERRLALTRGLEQAVPQAIPVPRANRLLIDAFDDRPGATWKTPAWPLPGGPAHWAQEVRRELAVGDAPECSMLNGLTA